MAKKPRLWVGVLLAIPPLLVSAAIAAWFMLPGLVLAEIEKQAAAHGVTLSECELELGLERLVLTACRFSAGGAGGATGTVDRIEIAIKDFTPTAVDVSGAKARLRQTPDFDELFERHKPDIAGSLPVRVTGSTLELVDGQTDQVKARLTELGYEAPSGDFDAQIEIGELFNGEIERRGSVVDVQLTLTQNPKAVIRARLEQDKALGELRLELRRVALSELDNPMLRIPPELKDVKVDAQIYAQIPIALNPKPPRGDLRLTFHGLNFPVPRELQGLVYGTPVEVSGDFTLDRSFTRAKLGKLSLSVGALDMKGDGKAELDATGIEFQASLSGSLSCAAIVQSAAAAHVDSELAKLAGAIARRALQGAVRIVALVSGRSEKLAQTTVVKSVGVGCGLRPLPLPKELEQLPRELLKNLPDLDKIELPTDDLKPPKIELPKLPKFEGLPRLKIRDGKEGDRKEGDRKEGDQSVVDPPDQR